MRKYFCTPTHNGPYLRGLCGNDDYSAYRVVETTFDAGNKYLSGGRPCWRVVDSEEGETVVFEPLARTPEEEAEEVEKEVDREVDRLIPSSRLLRLMNQAILALGQGEPLPDDYLALMGKVQEKIDKARVRKG